MVNKKVSRQERRRRAEQSLRDKHGTHPKEQCESQASVEDFVELEAAADADAGFEEYLGMLPREEHQIVLTILDACEWEGGSLFSPKFFEHCGIEDLNEKRLSYVIGFCFSAFEPSEPDDGRLSNTANADELSLLFSKVGGQGGIEQICELLDTLQKKIVGFKSQCLYVKDGQNFHPYQFNFSFDSAADEVRTA